MSEFVTYNHQVNSGDLVSALPGLKHIYDEIGKKAIIYQRLNMPGDYYDGAVHPLKNEKGVQVTMTQGQWNRLYPLLKSQNYIEECYTYEGENAEVDIDIDLNLMRKGKFTTMPYGVISRWQFYTHPLLSCDISKQWVFVEDNEGIKKLMDNKILLNFTERYRIMDNGGNQIIDYSFLSKWRGRMVFAGTNEEHDKFCNQHGLKMPYLKVDNFLESAQAIKHCKLVLCNQSTIWNIADAMKKLRVLETCPFAPHCPPTGKDGYDFLHQDAVKILMNKYMK